MIRNDSEFKESLVRAEAGRAHLLESEVQLRDMGLSAEEIARVLAPARGFQLKLDEEIAGYQCLKRGDLGPYRDIEHVGVLLIAARIAAGLSGRELAKRLSCHESQVSRDERNEYHGITAERVRQIAEAIGFEIHLRGELRHSSPKSVTWHLPPPIDTLIQSLGRIDRRQSQRPEMPDWAPWESRADEIPTVVTNMPPTRTPKAAA
jgi:transcriptional regulator with XRE-family HTH domain